MLAARLVAPVKALIASTVPGETRHTTPAHAPAEVHELGHALAALEARVQTHIVALDEASQAHNDALRRLCAEQRLATVGQMAGEVAHELNTPLANILGYAQLARTQNLDLALDESLDVIAVQARRAAQIVGDMLSVARAPAPAGQALDLAEVVQAFARLVTPLVRRQAVTLDVDAQLSAPAWGDAARIEQILFNLLTNATQAGAHRVHLRVAPQCLRVEDDGEGVPHALQARLFEPFVTSKPVGQGTGLGLAICRRLAEEMRGNLVLIASSPGRTLFELTLPLQAYPT
jgi:signal transduction histidine kinase